MKKAINLIRKLGLMPLVNSFVSTFYSCKKVWYKLIGKKDIAAVYDKKFFNHIEDITEPTAKTVADILYQEYRPKSIADIGCGPAVYLKEFLDKKCKITGIDGSPDVIKNLKIPKKYFTLHDLRDKLEIEKHDLAICFEVAEHIPTKFSKKLVDNVTRAADTVAFTAAPPGQGGFDHINEQKPIFWNKLFMEKGFIFDQDKTKKIIKEMKQKKVVWYIPENLFIFKKDKKQKN
jgi:SAM-dependent methyltransferase